MENGTFTEWLMVGLQKLHSFNSFFGDNMNMELKEAFKSEFYISTDSKQPDCKLWHSIGMHVCPDGIFLFNVDLETIVQNGGKPETIKNLRTLLNSIGFKKVAKEEKYVAPANMVNYDKGIVIIQDFDIKMDPGTKKMRYV